MFGIIGAWKVISAVVVAIITIPVSSFLNSYRKDSLIKSETIVAVAVVPEDDGMGHAKVVAAVPPSKTPEEAAIFFYSLWEKINGHYGRPCSKIVPIYADGHLSDSAIKGFRNLEGIDMGPRGIFSCCRFQWRDQERLGEIYLAKESYDFESLIKYDDNPDIPRINMVYRLLKEGMEKNKAGFISNHYVEIPFTIQELYGVNKLSDLDIENIEWETYLPAPDDQNAAH